MTEDLTGIGKIASSISEPIQAFLGTIFGPASAEFGELLADNVKFIRWKNTLRILEKAQREMEVRGLQAKEIPLKTLVPILEGASLESDSENLQAKWSNLLTSAASGNISHPSYPKILSELVYSEAKILDYLYNFELEFAARRTELNKVNKQYSERENIPLLRQKRQEVVNSFNIPPDSFRLLKIREVLSFGQDEFSQAIDNLLRLRLGEHPEEASEIDVITTASLEKYSKEKLLSGQDDDDEYDLDIEKESIISRVVDRNSIRLTKLGMNFMHACQPLP